MQALHWQIPGELKDGVRGESTLGTMWYYFQMTLQEFLLISMVNTIKTWRNSQSVTIGAIHFFCFSGWRIGAQGRGLTHCKEANGNPTFFKCFLWDQVGKKNDVGWKKGRIKMQMDRFPNYTFIGTHVLTMKMEGFYAKLHSMSSGFEETHGLFDMI